MRNSLRRAVDYDFQCAVTWAATPDWLVLWPVSAPVIWLPHENPLLNLAMTDLAMTDYCAPLLQGIPLHKAEEDLHALFVGVA